MENTLFNPHRMDVPSHLILIPNFWDRPRYQELKKSAVKCIPMMSSDILIFDDYAVLVSFLGYPHLLTLLEFIKDVRHKEIYFLGTAGSLKPVFNVPTQLAVSEIHATEILEHFASKLTSDPQVLPLSYQLKILPGPFIEAKGVTVDLIQRETVPWLRKQIEKGMEFVEMELYPLRVYLGKPFYALVVTSDLLTETGIQVHNDWKKLLTKFLHAYDAIVAHITTAS